MEAVIVDTGPLVAYFDRNDAAHPTLLGWFAEHARRYRILTTEAVVTEVTHMLDFSAPVQAAFLDWAQAALHVSMVPQTSYPEVAQWMRGYENVPMDYADATVLWLYRETRNARILTLDQRGFGVFRIPGQSRRRPLVIALG